MDSYCNNYTYENQRGEGEDNSPEIGRFLQSSTETNIKLGSKINFKLLEDRRRAMVAFGCVRYRQHSTW